MPLGGTGSTTMTLQHFKSLCQFLWGFEPSHPETAKLAEQELGSRGYGYLDHNVRIKTYGPTEDERKLFNKPETEHEKPKCGS